MSHALRSFLYCLLHHTVHTQTAGRTYTVRTLLYSGALNLTTFHDILYCIQYTVQWYYSTVRTVLFYCTAVYCTVCTVYCTVNTQCSSSILYILCTMVCTTEYRGTVIQYRSKNTGQGILNNFHVQNIRISTYLYYVKCIKKYYKFSGRYISGNFSVYKNFVSQQDVF